MVIFHCYVSSPEGIDHFVIFMFVYKPHEFRHPNSRHLCPFSWRGWQLRWLCWQPHGRDPRAEAGYGSKMHDMCIIYILYIFLGVKPGFNFLCTYVYTYKLQIYNIYIYTQYICIQYICILTIMHITKNIR